MDKFCLEATSTRLLQGEGILLHLHFLKYNVEIIFTKYLVKIYSYLDNSLLCLK